MFEIDLRRGAPPASQESPSSELAMSLAPVALGLAALVAVLWAVTWRLNRRVAAREEAATQVAAAVEASRRELADLSGKRRLLFETDRQEIYWSDELRVLSEKLPDKMWLTQVKVVSSGKAGEPATRSLAIEGGVLSNPSEGNLDLVGKFIQALEADRRFQETFRGLSLDSINRSSGDPYTLIFVLRAEF